MKGKKYNIHGNETGNEGKKWHHRKMDRKLETGNQKVKRKSENGKYK